jgi:zinc/manganese transport system substrate-binding protein
MQRFTLCLLAGGLMAAPVQAAEKLRVAATLTTFADLTRAIGGEHVDVDAIASPRFNAHFIEPRPSDVLQVKRAAALVHAGLDLEAWRGPLLDAAGNTRLFPGGEGEIDLSQGVVLLEVPDRSLSRAEGDIHLYGNPHYWLDPRNVQQMAQTICDRLCALDPDQTQQYHRNLAVFKARLAHKIPEWQAALKPFAGQRLIGYHNEWIYLMAFLGLRMEHYLEPKPGIPPTPRQLELLEGLMPREGIRVIIRATYNPARPAEVLARRTGARSAVLAQNVGEVAEAEDYVALMDHNVRQLRDALAGAPGS